MHEVLRPAVGSGVCGMVIESRLVAGLVGPSLEPEAGTGDLFGLDLLAKPTRLL